MEINSAKDPEYSVQKGVSTSKHYKFIVLLNMG